MGVIQAQQERADFLRWPLRLLFGGICFSSCRASGPAEAADHAISRPDALDLDHAGAFAGCVFAVEALGNHSIPTTGRAFAHPPFSGGEIRAGRREDDSL